MLYLGIVLCFIPVIICFCVSTFAFKIKISHQFLAILFGLIAIVPISLIQYLLPQNNFLNQYQILRIFLKSLIFYGLIEETLKMVLILPLPHKNYSPLNFLMLSFLFGAASGSFESTVYFIDQFQLSNLYGGEPIYNLIALRTFSSDIIHITCAGLCGLFVYSIRNKSKKISILFTAILLHGLYDFFVGFTNNLKWFAIIVILLAIVECRVKYVSFKKDNE